MFPAILDMENANRAKKYCAKDGMIHFNISVAIKCWRGDKQDMCFLGLQKVA